MSLKWVDPMPQGCTCGGQRHGVEEGARAGVRCVDVLPPDLTWRTIDLGCNRHGIDGFGGQGTASELLKQVGWDSRQVQRR